MARACPIFTDALVLSVNGTHQQAVPGKKVWLSFHQVRGTLRDGFGDGVSDDLCVPKKRRGLRVDKQRDASFS